MQHRLFIAVDLPAAVRRRLAGLVADAPPGVRPVPAGQVHLTLHFLGDADDAALAALAGALPRIRTPTFAISIVGTGAFPPRGRAAVLWAGVEESDPLRALHGEVAALVAACGFPPDPRPWVPHVTLARLGPRVPRGWTAAVLDRHRDLVVPGIRVESVRLYESIRDPRGTMHLPAATTALPQDSGQSPPAGTGD